MHRRGGVAEEVDLGRRKEVRLTQEGAPDLEIRVHSRRAGDWQVSLRDVEEQPRMERFWAFVDLQGFDPWFAVVPDAWMINNIHEEHAKYLARHGGRRAVTQGSPHHRVQSARIEQWRDKWDVLGLKIR